MENCKLHKQTSYKPEELTANYFMQETSRTLGRGEVYPRFTDDGMLEAS